MARSHEGDSGSGGEHRAVIGFGLAAIGRPAYLTLGHGEDLGDGREPDELEAHAHRMLDEAWANGVGYFDAARSYGRAEAFLASWLDERGFAEDARRPTVASKWGYRYVGGWEVDAEVHEVKELTIDQLDRQYQESRELLGPFLDVYQIHSATISSGVLDDDAVLDRLATHRGDGLVIGLTTTGPDQATTIARASEIERDGRPLFEVIQSTWNLLEPSAGPALAAAADQGTMIVVKEALANGRLAGRDRAVAERLEPDSGDTPTDQMALAAALAQPWATVVLSGATTIDQLRSNLAASEPAAISAAAELAALGSTSDRDGAEDGPGLAEDPAAYWQTRSDLAWT